MYSRLTLTPQTDSDGPLSAKVFGLNDAMPDPFPVAGGDQGGACPASPALQDIYCRLGLDTSKEYLGGIDFRNVEDFQAPDGNVTDRVVRWDPVPASIAGEPYSTPDLSPVVQEIFDSTGWSATPSDNDLALFITATTETFRRNDSYDTPNGSPALLQVDYVPEAESASGQQLVALRFRDVRIPQGADLQKAVIELIPVNDSDEPTTLEIRAERVAAYPDGTSPVFAGGDGTRELSTRLTDNGTVAVTEWDLTSADEWLQDSAVQTPDIQLVLEEVIADPGWCGGNDLVVFIKRAGGPADTTRRVYAHDADPAFAATLKIDFDEQQFGAGQGCTVDDVVRQVSASADDAEQNADSGQMFLTSTQMEMVQTSIDRANGVIFRDVPIPKSATVESAVVEFVSRTPTDTTSASTPAGAATITVQGIDSDLVPAFTTALFDVSDRVGGPRGTAATVTFPLPPAAVGSNDTVATADISPVIQEIVDRADWDHGDQVGLVFTGNGLVNLYTFDGDPSRAALLRARIRYNVGDVISAGGVPSVVTVRERIKGLVNDFYHSGNTPIVDTLFEAISYFRGDPVLYGRQRKTPLNTDTVARNTRLSHPESYSGGNVVYPPGCEADGSNLSADECKTQRIVGPARYTSPIQTSCQSSYILYFTDGAATTNSTEALAKNLMGVSECQSALSNGTSVTDQERCGIDLARFAFENDMSPDVAGVNNIVTYTIGYIAPQADGTQTPPEDADPLQINVPYLQDMAAAGDGQFLSAGSEESLVNAFKATLADVLSRTTSFAAPSLSVNAFNRLEDRNDVYFSLFQPSDRASWPGNVKKYQLCQSDLDPCVQSSGFEVGDVLDARTPPLRAVDDNGRIVDDALSFWSVTPDGPTTESGGAARQVPDHTERRVYTLTDEVHPDPAVTPLGTQAFTPLLPAFPAPVVPQPLPGTRPGQLLSEARNRLIDEDADGVIDGLDPGLTPAERQTMTRDLLAMSTEAPALVTDQIDWIRGKDVDNRYEDVDFGTNRFAFGDPLHGNPLAISYGGTESEPIVKLVVGTNDGGIRMINTFSGEEEWIFIPPSLAPVQKDMRTNPTGDRIYGVDGSPTPWIRDVGPSAENPGATLGVIEPQFGDFVRIVTGQRRGGNNYWALDLSPASEIPPGALSVTNHIEPTLMWRIRGGTLEYPMLGQTWSKPVLASVLFGTGANAEARRREVFIFAGGYEPDTQDAGYSTASAVGNAIYIADARTGERLFYAGGPGAEAAHVSGDGVEVADMRFPIPSDVAAFDADGDGAVDRLYVGDTGGQMWRVDLSPNRDQGGVRGVVGRLAVVSSAAAPADQRKFFYPPTVIQVRGPGSRSSRDYDLVSAVTGNRANPLGTTTRDRFYAFRDYAIRPLLDADGDGLVDPPAYTTIRGDLDGAPADVPDVPATTFGDMVDLTAFNGADDPDFTDQSAFDVAFGFYIRLDNSVAGEGEKGLAAPTTIAGRVFFTTYLPEGVVDDSSCTLVEGRGLLYGFDAITGAAIFNWDESGDDAITRTDRTYALGAGIPSSPVPVFCPEKVMLLVGVGGGAETVDPEIIIPRERTYWFQQDEQ
jgi:type IV pilus assembly protein PilY1